MKQIMLTISEYEYLEVIPDATQKDQCCCFCDVYYINKKTDTSIRFGYDYLSSLIYFITQDGYINKLINNEMIIATNADLGFIWNEYYNGNINTKEALKYCFISNSHKQIRPYFNSWLYNDHDNNIIFEITPFYPWHNVTEEKYKDFITYEKWIKDYKPTIKTKISKKNIKQWSKQIIK